MVGVVRLSACLDGGGGGGRKGPGGRTGWSGGPRSGRRTDWARNPSRRACAVVSLHGSLPQLATKAAVSAPGPPRHPRQSPARPGQGAPASTERLSARRPADEYPQLAAAGRSTHQRGQDFSLAVACERGFSPGNFVISAACRFRASSRAPKQLTSAILVVLSSFRAVRSLENAKSARAGPRLAQPPGEHLAPAANRGATSRGFLACPARVASPH